MKNRIFASIIVLLMIASVGIAVSVNESVVNESGVNESNISNENLNISNQTNENLTIDNQTKTNVPQDIINATINNTFASKESAVYISYTNPNSGISVFGSGFWRNIYTQDDTTWNSYTFYLPTSSYAYVNINGRGGHSRYLVYEMKVDNNIEQHINQNMCQDDPDDNFLGCNIEFQMSRLSYLSKGYHTINLSGRAEMGDLGLCGPSGVEDCYTIEGSISIMAFPEYTTIVVNSPNGGENWSRGATKSITWTSKGSPGANVKIELYKGSVRSAIISSKTPNDGSYSWYIPTYQPVGADYKIKITSYEDSIYNDWSNNNFKIY